VSNPSKRGAILYETEASFAVDTTTFATYRWPITGMVDTSGLKQNKLDTDRVTQRRQEGTPWTLGTFGGSTFRSRFELPGHGSVTTGATTASLLETLLGIVFGNVTSSGTGDTFTGAGTAAAPGTTAANGLVAGSLIRGGTLGDAKGNGQFVAVASHAANVATLFTAFDAVPTAANVLYSAVNVYPSEAPTSTTIQSIRVLLQTANLCYELHGVVPTNVSLGGFKAGQVPFIEVTWAVAWWRYSTQTFPNAVATETFMPAPTAAGSLFVNDVGTTTRAAANLRRYTDLTIDYKLGVELVVGPGGVNQFQELVQAIRTVDEIRVSWIENADAQTLTPVLPGYGTATTFKHVLLTHNPTATKAMGIYMPNVCVTNVAVQYQDQNINRLKVEGMAYTGTTTTSDLTASAFRMAFS
jgi:hypothetical protein